MYQSIFFDLDRTLWDLDRNNAETLHDLCYLHRLNERGVDDIPLFISNYNKFNHIMWELYRKEQIDKELLRWKRFHDTLLTFGIDDFRLANRISDDFISICPMKTGLMPHALETIDYLSKKYPLYIITNGFEEIQHVKLSHCGLSPYFTKMITSEGAGYKKPDVRIFEHAVQCAGVDISTCVMIGDEYETDILGAQKAGMDTVFYSPGGRFGDAEATHKITSLRVLTDLL